VDTVSSAVRVNSGIDTLPPSVPDSPTAPEGPLASAPASEAPVRRDVVLDVRDLKTYFFTYDGVVKALDGVSFKVRRGETLGLVGETGCGKSVTAFSITRLIPDPPGRVMSGKILYRGANLLWNLEREATFKPIRNTGRVKIRRRFRQIRAAMDRMSAVRGGGVSTIFQEPTSAMNPIFSISDQIGEALLLHRGMEIVDALLNAKPDDPAVAAAIDHALEVSRHGTNAEVRAAALAIGTAVGVPTLGVQAYYILREAGPSAPESKPEILHALRRLKFSGLQRTYLRRERRIAELRKRANEVYLTEMRTGSPQRMARVTLSRQRTTANLRTFYLNLWGLRRHVRRTIQNELYWRTVATLEGVGIGNPVQVARGYPHELSGGMLQRVMIAMALSSEPDILLADEPTTALDVTIQAQILELMRELKTRVGTAIVLITHDLAVIAEVADRVCVMYAGHIVETASVAELYHRPLHPYTQGLLASIPRLDQPDKELTSIPGSVPNLITPPTGCRFHPRCPHAMPVCKTEHPPTTVEGSGHTVACYLYTGPVAVE
jgi:peptide/nickel transport system ATP-binding protein